MQTGFIVAIDLGTSKITGIVGRINDNNVISVMAHESIPSDGCIRRGLVYNSRNTGGAILKLINFLEKKVQRRIGRVYVSIGGQSFHTEMHSEVTQLSSSGIVTEETIAQLRAKVEKYNPNLKSKYAIADVEYFVDDRPENNPVGVTCTQIEADYQIIVGRSDQETKIKQIINDDLHLGIAGFVIGPLASAAIALNDEEKELGCAFIDFGAGTTTLSIYKDGILRHLVVIPFGGRAITKDICELNFVESDAEQYKIKFGKVKDNQEDRLFSSPFSSKPEIDLVELNKVIRMRLDEITANIQEQIRLSGYEDQLGAGLVVTGGASQLKNIDQYLADKLKMPVRKASAKKTMVNNSPDLANDPAMTQVLGMLLFAKEDCEYIEIKNVETEDKNDRTGRTGRIGKRGNTIASMLFGTARENPDKEQQKREKEIEREKRRREKEKETERPDDSGGFFDKMGNAFKGMFDEEEEEGDNEE